MGKGTVVIPEAEVEELGVWLCLDCGQGVIWVPQGTRVGSAWLLTAPQAGGLHWKHSRNLGCLRLNLECCPSCQQKKGENGHLLRKGTVPLFPAQPPRELLWFGVLEDWGGHGLQRSPG